MLLLLYSFVALELSVSPVVEEKNTQKEDR